MLANINDHKVVIVIHLSYMFPSHMYTQGGCQWNVACTHGLSEWLLQLCGVPPVCWYVS